ncbi:MAG: hypothetical protein LC659_10645, partial [Myxococcales bacterium]|nr:hypothetical protein [Myxococcales bacterium]
MGELGATKVVLMTFHGAPLHNLAIEAGGRTRRHRERAPCSLRRSSDATSTASSTCSKEVRISAADHAVGRSAVLGRRMQLTDRAWRSVTLTGAL